MRGGRFLVEVLGKTQQQNIAQKIEDRFFQGRVPPLRRRDRALDDGTVFVADRLARRDVGPIDRETGDRFANRASKRLEGEVAKPAILLRQPVEHVAENVHIVCQRQPHDEEFLRINKMAERHRMPDETLERFRDRLLRGTVDEHIRHQLAEFIAGRAVDGPVRAQSLVAR